MQILQSEPKLPAAGQYSEELIDFCRACLHKDPTKRSTVVQLMAHPFILKYRSVPVDMRAFMRTVVNPQTSFDEVAFLFAHQYYQLLTGALQADPALFDEILAVVAALYQPSSVYTFAVDGKPKDTATGASAIEVLLHRRLRSMKGFGVRAFEVESVNCSGVLGSPRGVLLNVRGKILGDGASEQFAEAFTLIQQGSGSKGGPHCVAKQSFSTLGS